MAKFGIICAAPRSGTTVLSDAVSAAYQVACPSEIFHDLYTKVDLRNLDWEQAGNFFAFRSEALRHRPELNQLDIGTRRELFDLYLDHLRELFATDRFLVDIKYNSWHHLDGYWRFPTDPPGLIQLIREKEIPVVHLIRENLFALYCSLRMAELSNVWHRERGQPENNETLRVDVDHCQQWMTQMAGMQQLFAKWLSGHAVHTLTYESLIDHGRFASRVSEVFTNIFGREPVRELTSTYTKILPPLCRVIENARAVTTHFDGTEFASFVKTSLECG